MIFPFLDTDNGRYSAKYHSSALVAKAAAEVNKNIRNPYAVTVYVGIRSHEIQIFKQALENTKAKADEANSIYNGTVRGFVLESSSLLTATKNILNGTNFKVGVRHSCDKTTNENNTIFGDADFVICQLSCIKCIGLEIVQIIQNSDVTFPTKEVMFEIDFFGWDATDNQTEQLWDHIVKHAEKQGVKVLMVHEFGNRTAQRNKNLKLSLGGYTKCFIETNTVHFASTLTPMPSKQVSPQTMSQKSGVKSQFTSNFIYLLGMFLFIILIL